MTLVILLLALLAFVVSSRSEPSAQAASSAKDETARAHARPTPGERHEPDDGLTSQPLLSRTRVMTGKARPTMTSTAQQSRSPWQGDAAALNPSLQKGPMAIDARIPSGDLIARASARAS